MASGPANDKCMKLLPPLSSWPAGQFVPNSTRQLPQNADTYKLKQNQKLRRPEEEAFPSHSTRTNSKCVCMCVCFFCVCVCVFRLCGLSALVRQLGKTVDCRGVVGGLHSTNYANAYLEWYSLSTDKQK